MVLNQLLELLLTLSLLSLLFFNAAPPLDVPQQGTTLILSFEEPRQVPLTLVYI